MRRNEIERAAKAARAKQPFTLTSEEIMADLLYPVPVRVPRRRRARR